MVKETEAYIVSIGSANSDGEQSIMFWGNLSNHNICLGGLYQNVLQTTLTIQWKKFWAVLFVYINM